MLRTTQSADRARALRYCWARAHNRRLPPRRYSAPLSRQQLAVCLLNCEKLLSELRQARR